MSDIFTSYEQQFIKNLANTSKKIQHINVQSNQKKQMAFVQLKQDILQCDQDIKRMEAQVNTFDVQIRFEYNRKVKQYKKDLQDQKKKLNKAQDQYAHEKNKEMLLGAQLQQQKYTKRNQKQTLIKHGQMLSDTTYKLKDSVRVMRQTQDISNNVGVELVRQTQQMKGQKQKLLQMNQNLSKSQRLVKNIMLRIRKNKLTLAIVVGITVLIGIIILIIRFTN